MLHDRAYAMGGDLTVADDKFYEAVKDLGLKGFLYGNAVKHGNRTVRMLFWPKILTMDWDNHPNLRGPRGVETAPPGHTSVVIDSAGNAYEESESQMVYGPVPAQSSQTSTSLVSGNGQGKKSGADKVGRALEGKGIMNVMRDGLNSTKKALKRRAGKISKALQTNPHQESSGLYRPLGKKKLRKNKIYVENEQKRMHFLDLQKQSLAKSRVEKLKQEEREAIAKLAIQLCRVKV